VSTTTAAKVVLSRCRGMALATLPDVGAATTAIATRKSNPLRLPYNDCGNNAMRTLLDKLLLIHPWELATPLGPPRPGFGLHALDFPRMTLEDLAPLTTLRVGELFFPAVVRSGRDVACMLDSSQSTLRQIKPRSTLDMEQLTLSL
jgi:hypothetical protein